MLFIHDLPTERSNAGRLRSYVLVECDHCHKQYKLRKELFDVTKNHSHCTKKYNTQSRAVELLAAGFKTCGHCKQFLPLTAFGKRARTPTGIRSTCKQCEKVLNENVSKRYRERPENKQRKKQYDAVYTQQPKQKQRKNELNLIWRQNNPDKVKAIADNDRHTRRVQTKASTLSTKALAKWTQEQPKICSYCSCTCSTNFHIDHIDPLSKGGTHTLDNLTISCPSCNSSKSNKPLLLWLAFKCTL